MWVQKNQGTTKYNLTFGYVGEDGACGGGYFFTWHSTLERTLASIEEDTQDPPRRMKLARAEREVRRIYRDESRKEWSSLIP